MERREGVGREKKRDRLRQTRIEGNDQRQKETDRLRQTRTDRGDQGESREKKRDR